MTEEAFQKVIFQSWECEDCKREMKAHHRLCKKHSKELYNAIKND